jgi:ATP-binding cassette, subfamily A (ABC1), member 3
MIFLTFARNLFISNNVFGIGSGQPVKTLQQGLAAADGDRKNLVFVNNGLRYLEIVFLAIVCDLTRYSGGNIDRVIDSVAATVPPSITVVRLTDPSDILTTCRSSLRGVTQCFGYVIQWKVHKISCLY